MRSKLAPWLRALLILAALTAFALAWFDALPSQVPDPRRGRVALLAVAAVLGVGVDLLRSTLRSSGSSRQRS